MMNRQLARRIASLALVVVAVLETAEIVRQAQYKDPPMGALCLAATPIIILIAAGALWSGRNRH